MKSIGELITDANAEDGPAERAIVEPRPYRVTLCVMAFAEIVVVADSPQAAMRLAEARATEATPKFFTEPGASRVEVQKRSNPRDPLSPLVWVEVKAV